MRIAQPEDWDDDIVRRFWAFKLRNPRDARLYFSRMVGRALARFAQLAGVCRGRALDFGCGPGYLLEWLAPHFAECYGIDFSADAAAATQKRLEGRSQWRGAQALEGLPTPFAEGFFEFVSCVETIEHLRDDQLVPTLREIRRLLAPGGAALFTTPNSEQLDDAFAFCPFCDTAFHEWQHVRSFTPESLRQVLEAHGFEVSFIRGIDLGRFQSDGRTGDALSQRLGWRLRWAILVAMDRLLPARSLRGHRFRYLLGDGPHLCALVKVASIPGTRTEAART